ncbi:MAG TPA: discoidin domain-containing protein [Butyricimonas virosa]|uniref:Discoidin domain-containing protein n=1 Tax=Butyricimonas virosa TaxID=544645 RepID=A0A921H5N4_9BACT|nr:discoidin domain-containing protein [Butyricimonas virosa]
MKKRKLIINLFAAAALLVGCSESLEDTYSDYAGDGKIRYVAKCSDLQSTAGWERLIINWVNGTDATVDKIKVVWSCEDRRDSILLPKDATSFELKELVDGTYRFDVSALNAAGRESLKETTYARPYTKNHEIMLAFTRGIVKAFSVKDKLIFFSDHWNDNIKELILHYTKTNGEPGTYEFNESNSNELTELSGVDFDKRIYVTREGKPVGCPDNIKFDDYVLSENKKDFQEKKVYTVGFVHAIERRYGYSRDTKEEAEKFEEFVNGVTELEFDHDIESFEDVLHCPNLKKLVFCKNRYADSFSEWEMSEVNRNKLLGDEDRTFLVLNVANKSNVLGLKIEWYGANSIIPYFSRKPYYMKCVDVSYVPEEVEVIKKEELKEYNGKRIICNPTDLYANVDFLLDNNSSSKWETTSVNDRMRTYELQMEFEEVTSIDGVKVTQSFFRLDEDSKTPAFMPKTITAQTSIDGVAWKDVTFLETNDLGCDSGETTLLRMVDHETKELCPREVRYIKFTLRDGVDQGGNCSISLGDLVPYRLKK